MNYSQILNDRLLNYFISPIFRPMCNFIKKETLAQVFSYELCKFLRTPILQNTSGRLFLNMINRVPAWTIFAGPQFILSFCNCWNWRLFYFLYDFGPRELHRKLLNEVHTLATQNFHFQIYCDYFISILCKLNLWRLTFQKVSRLSFTCSKSITRTPE